MCALQRSELIPFAIPFGHRSMSVLQDIQYRSNSFKLVVGFARNFVLRGVCEDDKNN